ncbi:SGNH/GDSL hydrolase family protein [Sphaerisporangium fuscum]|uniref:SGNH/GDSL hydrolase family protein n=1 Tax=Sphaerisporangium fuscum TaxID=2835868 RepID=UPI001BDD94EF|nr:GDSL-type esterase/lipase family protein [Sphaerisporangium fuscum]
MNFPFTERLVRFQQPEKVLTYLGKVDEAHLFGLDPDEHRALLEGFDEQVRKAAADLLGDPGTAERVDRLPFAPGDHVVVIGESTSADRLSWFEILRHLVSLRRPSDGITFTNLAISGCTTTQALTGLPGLAHHRPDWVLCMLGGNDARRLGGADGPTLVSLAETERNLLALRDLAAAHVPARWVWLTPSAVDERRAAAYPHFQRAGLSWGNGDIDAIARFLLDRPEPAVDTRTATIGGTESGLHLDDGVHLTPAGQRAVAAAVVEGLARLS